MQLELNKYIEAIYRRKSQAEKILDLLNDYDFVPTRDLLSAGIYQYNARIFELRRGKLNNTNYIIEPCEVDGLTGFRLEHKYESS